MRVDKSDQPRIVRSPLEIQRAHDLLVTLIVNAGLRQQVLGDSNTLGHLCAAADVICWVLGHEHNQSFEQNLKALEAAMEKHGYVLRDAGRLIRPGELPCS